MSAATKTRTTTDDYFQLVHEFPLRPIRGRAEYELAGRMLNRLLGRPNGKLTRGERDYLDALVLLAADYDKKHSRFFPSKRTPQQALSDLAAEANIGPTELGRMLGTTHAMASLMLHGKRGITAASARALADYFKVDVGMFV
jgi:antitoxin component HigA of HigAB toxin-antitoxin module